MTDEDTNESNEAGEEPNPTETLFERTDSAAARLEEANKKTEDLLNRQEEVYAKQILGGQASGGQEKEKEVPLSDTEYAEALERGEVNPLKEDGII